MHNFHEKLTVTKAISDTRYIGKVCESHPELKGERRKKTYLCVGCIAEKRKIFRAQPIEVRSRNADTYERRQKDRIARRIEAVVQKKIDGVAVDMAIAAGTTEWQQFKQAAREKLEKEGGLTVM